MNQDPILGKVNDDSQDPAPVESSQDRVGTNTAPQLEKEKLDQEVQTAPPEKPYTSLLEKLRSKKVFFLPKGEYVDFGLLTNSVPARVFEVPGGNLLVLDTNIEPTCERDEHGNVAKNEQGEPVMVEGAVRIENDPYAIEIDQGRMKNLDGRTILNVDHHFRDPKFYRQISTANLAIEYVRANGPIAADYTTIVNHFDCDSVLSLLIMTGVLPPDDIFGEAAIAADHTGMENDLADMLQPLDKFRDVEKSVRNIELLLNDKPLEPDVQEKLEKRRADRERAKRVAEEQVQWTPSGKIAYVFVEEKIEGELMPACLPEAELIVLGCPFRDDPEKTEVKVRLGSACPPGFNVTEFMESRVDKNFGGRWNAGANARKGGTSENFQDYVNRVEEEYEKYRAESLG